MNTYLKWFLLVAFNAVYSLTFALDFMKTLAGIFGIIMGIVCFILIYVKLDEYLLNRKKVAWRKALFIGVIMTGILSLYPMFPIISGSLALQITGSLFNLPPSGVEHVDFLPIFSTTVITGGLLSLVVLFVSSILRILFFIYPRIVENDDNNS